MTQETIEALKPFEQQLRRAHFGNYIMPMGVAETKKLYEIYNAEFGEHETNTACGQCRYKAAKRLGERYFAALDVKTDPTAVVKVFNRPSAPQPETTPKEAPNKPVETPKPQAKGNTPTNKKKRK